MEADLAGFKKVSHCWWFDSHSSAKRSTWLQSTLSELEKKTKIMLNLIEGDADSFAQRAEMYYRKRPELVNMIEDFYRSYRNLAEQHELLRCEAGARRTTLVKSDSLIQSCAQKTWDSTEVDDYPESEVSEVDNPELEDADQIESVFVAANGGFEGTRKNLEAKSPLLSLVLTSSAAADPEIHDKINSVEVSAKSNKSKRISYIYGNKQRCLQMETDDQDEIKLTEVPFRKENDKNTMNSMNEELEADDFETKALFEKIVDDAAKLTSEVEGLRMEKETLMAELEEKNEEKRQVIRQLSLTVEILKEENVILKKFIKDSKKGGSFFEFKKLKDAFSGTRRLFGLTARFQPSLVAL